MATGSHANTVVYRISGLRNATTIAQLLAGAIKHYSLYPEDHSIAKQHTKKILDSLTSFLHSHETLHYDIGKNTILYDGDIAYQGKAEENDLAFLLGRDGVEWIEFSRELELWEIQILLRMINNNRRNDIESDGNIANALWEQDFPHIEYKTIDLMAMDLPLMNLCSFQVAPSVTGSAENTQHVSNDARWGDYYSHEIETCADPEEEEAAEETAKLALTDPKDVLWHLSELEQFQLEAMVHNEENNTETEGAIDILFIILLLQNNEQEAEEVLSFLQDRFLYCLQNHQFSSALKIIRTLQKIASSDNNRHEILRPKVATFFTLVCQPESLRDLEHFFAQPDKNVSQDEILSLWTLLHILPPILLRTLAQISKSINMKKFGPKFLTLIESFALQDSRYLAAVAQDMDEKTCVLLFPLMQRLSMEDSIPLLTSLSLHPSPLIRTKAFSILKKWKAVNIYSLFTLIDDPDKEIKETIVELAGKKRDQKLERMLRKYLEESLSGTEDNQHIISCYHALGKAGSSESIPFLKNILLQGSKLGTLFAAGGGPHKEGAARALLGLRLPESRIIVKEGAANILPDVRAACRKVLGERYG